MTELLLTTDASRERILHRVWEIKVSRRQNCIAGVMYGAGELTTGNFVSHLVREPSFLPPRTCQRPGCFILNLYLISNHTWLHIQYIKQSWAEPEKKRCFLQLIERFNGRLPCHIGDGNDVQSFSHVDDVVSGHIAAMEKGRVGERYLLTGENVSLLHMFNLAANITNTNPPRFHLPLWLLEIYGWVSVFVAQITEKPPLISYPVCPIF